MLCRVHASAQKEQRLGVATIFDDGSDVVGHSYITLENADGSQEAIGFYPYDASASDVLLGDTVQGSLSLNDGAHIKVNSANFKGMSSVRYVNVSPGQVKQIRSVISDYKGSNYNLYSRSCADFVIDAARAGGVDMGGLKGSSGGFDTPRGIRSWIQGGR